MFWKCNDKEQKGPRLPGPRDLPELVKKYLSSEEILDPGIIPFVKAVVKNSEKSGKGYDIRVFDPADAEAREIKVQNYDTLSENPDLVIIEGWFEEVTKKMELLPRRAIPKTKFSTYEEILQQIEGLKEPGSSIYFFTNAGAGTGGPLGRGAALIRVNTPVEGKRQKKYAVYGVSVVNLQPVQKESKIFDSDKPAEIAAWVASSHKPRFC